MHLVARVSLAFHIFVVPVLYLCIHVHVQAHGPVYGLPGFYDPKWKKIFKYKT